MTVWHDNSTNPFPSLLNGLSKMTYLCVFSFLLTLLWLWSSLDGKSVPKNEQNGGEDCSLSVIHLRGCDAHLLDSGSPRHARCSRDVVGSGSPQQKSRAVARDMGRKSQVPCRQLLRGSQILKSSLNWATWATRFRWVYRLVHFPALGVENCNYEFLGCVHESIS